MKGTIERQNFIFSLSYSDYFSIPVTQWNELHIYLEPENSDLLCRKSLQSWQPAFLLADP